MDSPKVIISNGFSLCHLAVAAEEVHRRGVLAHLITGAYPQGWQRKALSLARHCGLAKLGRVEQRRKDLPDALVEPMWGSELIDQAAFPLRAWRPTRPFGNWLAPYAMRLYARQSAATVRAAAREAGIFHYRSGFGHEAARVARALGLVLLCDHAAPHPSWFEYLAAHAGRPPPRGEARPRSRFWAEVEDDLANADAVLVNSDNIKDMFLAMGWPAHRVHVRYLGVDDAFVRAADRFDGVPAADGEEAALHLLFAGIFKTAKGAEALIEAVRGLGDVAWRLELAGPIDPEMRRRHPRFFSDRRVVESGILRRDVLARRMREADVFVFPSFAEGSARVVFEALTCGCYVIATPNAGSVVEDGVHGALVSPGESEGIAAAIRQAAGDRKRIAAIGAANAKLVRARYRQRDYGDGLIDLYGRLSAARHGSEGGAEAGRAVDRDGVRSHGGGKG